MVKAEPGVASTSSSSAALDEDSERRARSARLQDLLQKIKVDPRSTDLIEELILDALDHTALVKHPFCALSADDDEARRLHREVQTCMLRVRSFRPIEQIVEWLGRVERAVLSCTECADGYAVARGEIHTRYLHVYPPASHAKFDASMATWESDVCLSMLVRRNVTPGGGLGMLPQAELYFCTHALGSLLGAPGTRPAKDTLLERIGSAMTRHALLRNVSPGLLALALLPGKAEAVQPGSSLSPRDWAREQLSALRLRPVPEEFASTPLLQMLVDFGRTACEEDKALLRKWGPPSCARALRPAAVAVKNEPAAAPATDASLSAAQHPVASSSRSSSSVAIAAQDWAAAASALASSSSPMSASLAKPLLASVGERDPARLGELLRCFTLLLEKEKADVWEGGRDSERAAVALSGLLGNAALLTLLARDEPALALGWTMPLLASLRGLPVSSRSGDVAGGAVDAHDEALRRIVNFCLERCQAGHVHDEARLRGAAEGIAVLRATLQSDEADAALRVSSLYASTIASLALRGRLPARSALLPSSAPARAAALQLMSEIYASDAARLEEAFCELSTLTRAHNKAWSARRRRHKRSDGSEMVHNPDGQRTEDVYVAAAAGPWPSPVLCPEMWNEGKAASEDASLFLEPLARLSVFVEPTLSTHMLPETKGSAGFASYRSALKTSILSLSRALRTQRSALSSALVAVGDAGREAALQSLCVEHTAALITAILSPEQDVHRAALNVVRATFDEASTRADCFMALLRSSPERALEGLQDYLTRFVAALSLLVEANEAARWMVRSFTDIIDALCAPLEGLLRNGTPHSYLDSPAARDAISRHVPSIWALMCQSIASIFKHTPSWSRVLAQEELVAWFRDVLLFACDTVEHAVTVRAAVESLPQRDDDDEDFIFAALALPLEEACNWLRMNNEAILSETRAYIVKALDRFKDDVPLPKTVQQSMLSFIDAQLAEPDADRRKTLLSTTELQELRGLLIPAGAVVEISDDDEDFEILAPSAPSSAVAPARSADNKASPTTVSSFWQASQASAPSASQERKRRMKQQKLSWAKAKPIDVDALPTMEPPARPAASAPRPSANKYQPASARTGAPKAGGAPPPRGGGGLLSSMRSDFNAQRQVIFRPNNVNQRPRLPSDRDLAAPIKAPAAYSTVTGAQPEGGVRKATTAAASDSSSESSSEEDGDQAKGLAALTGRKPKSPIKMRKAAVAAAAPPRRTMMLHDTRAEDLARERAEAERKRRLRAPADFGQLHRSILSWPFHVDGSEPPTLPGQPAPRFLDVPAAGFTSAEQYASVFGPMLLLECWAELQGAKEEIERGAPEKRPINVEIVSRSSVDGFVDLTASLPAGLVSGGPKGFRLMDTDVVYLSELAGASAVAPRTARTVLAKVEAFRAGHGNSGVTLRCCISSDRQGVGSALVPGSRWQLGKLFALTTLHRECAALMAFADFDLVGDVLHGRAASRSPIPNAEIEAVMAQHAVNRPQAEAIIGAMSSEKGISLIQGPPGTGKTKTICSLVAHFIATRRAPATSVQAGRAGVREPKKKILLCAPSNAAIDEVARRAQQGVRGRDGKMTKPVVVRVGREETMNVGVKHISLDALLEARLSAHGASGGDGGAQDPSVIHAEIKSLRDEKDAKLHELETERANGGGNAARIGQLQAEVKNLSARRMAAMSRLDEAKDQRQTRARQAEADRRRVQYEILADADVVCTTLAGAGHALLAQLPFDFETVVIDEAAQAVELSSLIPLRYGCRRAILVGDPNQLPPTVISQRAQRLGYAQSLFVRIFEAASSSVYLLSIQYRMHPLISSFPSRVFYDSKLSDGPGMAELTAQPWHKETLLKPFRFFDAYRGSERAARGHSVVNSEEAQIAAALYERLKAEARRYSKDLDYRVGVVTMYKEQVFELKRTFLARFGPDVADVVDFNTVDGFQGQEKDVIILSAVRTSAVGFLNDRRRVNVALTRAKSNVFVIGCAKLLRTDKLWGTLVAHADSLGVLSSVVPATFSMLAAQASPRKSLPSASPAPRKSATPAAPAAPTSAGAMTPAQLRKQTPTSSKASPAAKRSRPPSPSGTPPVIPAPPPPSESQSPGPPPKRPRLDGAPAGPSPLSAAARPAAQPPAQARPPNPPAQARPPHPQAQRLQQWKPRHVVDTSRPSAPPVIRTANPPAPPPQLSKKKQKLERRAQQQQHAQQQAQHQQPSAQPSAQQPPPQQAGPSRPAGQGAAAPARPAGPSAAALGSLFVKKKPPKKRPGAL